MRSRTGLLVRIGREMFDALFQLDRDELAPGERAFVCVWFLEAVDAIRRDIVLTVCGRGSAGGGDSR